MDLYGPPLPPGYVKPDDSDESSSSELETTTQSKVIGPQCPNILPFKKRSRNDSCDSLNNSSETTSMIGPELPIHLRKPQKPEDSDETFGPTLTEFSVDVDYSDETKTEIEKRAKRMKDKLCNTDILEKKNEREEWMTVPDTSRRNQLGAISRCLAPSQSSSTKEKHVHSHRHSEKDRETSEELKKYNKSRRSESLMDMHSKKLKKEKKKSKEKKERTAFDRDEMAVRQFTKQQVNSVIDKAKYLNSRFAPGKSNFL